MELYLPNPIFTKRINLQTKRFLPGHVPFNKGKSWDDYLPEETKATIRKNLEKGRIKGNPDIGKTRCKKVVGIKNGKIIGQFESANEAGRQLSLDGRNIRNVCDGKHNKCGGVQWFWAADFLKYEPLIEI